MTESASAAARGDKPAVIVAITLAGLVGSAIPIIIPSLVDALTRFRGMETAVAGQILSAEMFGMMISTAAVAPLVSRFDRRMLAAIALVLTGLANLGSILLASADALYPLRLAAGIGEGALIALVAAALGATVHAARNFGIFIAANMLLSAVLFRGAPLLLDRFGITGVFGALLVLVAAAALTLPLFPSRAPAQAAGAAPGKDATRGEAMTVILALLGFFAFYTGLGVVWTLMPYFASQLGVADAAVADTLSNATLAGLGAALLATFLGARFGRTPPLMVGALVLIASMVAIASVGAPVYPLAAAALMGAWMFSAPFLLATLAAADASGRAVAFSMSLQFGGLALGPLLGPKISAAAGAFAPIWGGVALIVLAAVLILLASPRRTG